MRLLKLTGCFLIIALVLSTNGYSQKQKLDSLYKVLKTAKEDTNKIYALDAIANTIFADRPDSTILLAQQAGAIATKLGWLKGESMSFNIAGIGYIMKGDYQHALQCDLTALQEGEESGDLKSQGRALGSLGNIYVDMGEYPQALDAYTKALGIFQKLGDKRFLSSVYGNMGNIYLDEGDYPKALDYYLKGLQMSEEMHNQHSVAINLGNIGIVYNNEGDHTKALDYYHQALKISIEKGYKEMQGNEYDHIGSANTELFNFDTALVYFQLALKIREDIHDEDGQANALGNMGSVFSSKKNYTKALEYVQKALGIAEKLEDKDQIARHLGAMGDVYEKTGKLKEAEECIKKAIVIDSSIGDRFRLLNFDEALSQLYNHTGQYKPALDWYKKAMVLKDTLFNIDKDKALTKKELTYQYEKKEALAKADQEKKDAIADEDKRKQKLIVWAVLGGLSLAIVFSIIIFRSLRITRKQKVLIEIKNEETEKQKALIEQQKLVVEEKNKDILDSISYAKRLQDAILPPLSTVKKYLPESFVLYKPKDIVAGDFYWVAPLIPIAIGTTKGETIDNKIPPSEGREALLIAAADCTGHGVPGAMVSVVCSNALNRTVKEFKITEPGKILDKVRELVLETFEKSESEVQDGMDISLCWLNTQTGEMKWSGANNPLWYIQNNEMKEVTADKQPIGSFDDQKPFTTNTFNLKKGDTIYLFTDGYADQFGGPKGKKFKYKQMQEKLLAISTMAMDKQKELLDETLQAWKGDLEQVDDVLIIGIRI